MSNYPPPPPSGQPGDPSVPPGSYRASDGNIYQQQGYQPQGMQPPPPKKGGAGKVLLIILGVIVAVCGLGGIAIAVAGNSAKEELDKTASSLTSVTAGPATSAAGGAATTAAPGTAAPGTAKTPATKAGFGDVTITACALSDNEFLGPEATVKVTNNSSKPSNYSVQIAFVSKDGATQYDTGGILVSGLAPGQSTVDKAASLKSEVRTQAAGGFNCKVLDVTRFAS